MTYLWSLEHWIDQRENLATCLQEFPYVESTLPSGVSSIGLSSAIWGHTEQD